MNGECICLPNFKINFDTNTSLLTCSCDTSSSSNYVLSGTSCCPGNSIAGTNGVCNCITSFSGIKYNGQV